MNVSKIGIYSAIAKSNVNAVPFRGTEEGDNKAKASKMLNDLFLRPVRDEEIEHLDLPQYAEPEKGRFTGRLKRDAEFNAMSTNTGFDRFEKSNDAADQVIRYTLQQIADGNASINSDFNYEGLGGSKGLSAIFRNGISVSLKYNSAATDKPNIITVTSRSGEKQEILLYDNGLKRSKRVEALRKTLLLV